jgi:hypothetical protein
MINQTIAHTLHACSKELYHTTVQYGQACLFNDKEKASTFWQSIIEGYKDMDELIMRLHKLEIQMHDTADIMAELEQSD